LASGDPTSQNESTERKSRKLRRRTWLTILWAVIGVVIYAWAFDTTNVTLDTIESETRQTQLFRVLRALAHPNIFERDTEDVTVRAQVYVPCGDSQAVESDTTPPYITITPNCGDPDQEVIVQGFGFVAGSEGPISFVPPSGALLGLGDFTVDDNGGFIETVELRDRPDEVAQEIQVIARAEVGGLHLTQTALDTIDKALETIFMALLATTIGTFLAIPLSFLASRNLMRPIKSPMVSIALGVLGLPVGLFAGIWAARLARRAVEPIVDNGWLDLLGIAVIGAIVWQIIRYMFREPTEDTVPTRQQRLGRVALWVLVVLASVTAIYLAADLLVRIGDALANTDTIFRAENRSADTPQGFLFFIANFIFLLGDTMRIAVPVITAVLGLGAFAQLGSLLGRGLVKRAPATVEAPLRYLSAAAAGAVILIGIGFVLEWLYQWDNVFRTFWVPAIAGIVLGLLLAFRTRRFDQVSTGLTLYYMARTLFNALRSIEPLVMAIIFVVWVGIGPFAGALALSLHTAAALAKLYSEQVESIAAGPIEAIQATGANRLQTVIYAVVPQIVPPYISFTLYRWDINVRMSTIIGFVGGGGLGLILKQNVDLLQYRDAAVQMFAIAIIVASMDYLSARLRERLV